MGNQEFQRDLEELDNENLPSAQRNTGLVEERKARASSEIQSALVIAQRFPRDELNAEKKIIQACKRFSLAESSMYTFPRGGKAVKGPSIRLAETLARLWGNVKYGFNEIESGPESSVVEAFAWDFESNVMVTRSWTVEHTIAKKNNEKKVLTDPRDRYENMANSAARRMRACILEVIPGEITEAAVKQCQATLEAGQGSEPIIDRVRKMVLAFDELGVTKEHLEKRLGHSLENCIPRELADLTSIYRTIKDGVQDRSVWFDFGAPAEGGKASTLKDRLQNGGNKEAKVEAKTETKAEPAKQPDPKKTAKAADDGPEAAQDNFENFQGGTVGSGSAEVDKRGK